MIQPVTDPLDRRQAEDLLAAAAKTFDVVAEGFDASLGLDECLRMGLTSPAFADEVKEVGEPALLGAEQRGGNHYHERPSVTSSVSGS